MTTHPSPARPGPQRTAENPHRPPHSQTGALPGEHPGRSGNPRVKAAGRPPPARPPEPGQALAVPGTGSTGSATARNPAAKS